MTDQERAQARMAEYDVEVETRKAQEAPNVMKLEGKWYIECVRCLKPALFLTVYPEGDLVHSDTWYSTYKATDSVYVADKVPCQNCGKPIENKMYPDGSFLVLHRTIECTLQIEKAQKEADLERRRLDAQRQIVVMNEGAL